MTGKLRSFPPSLPKNARPCQFKFNFLSFLWVKPALCRGLPEVGISRMIGSWPGGKDLGLKKRRLE
jgi:hypothetical protein